MSIIIQWTASSKHVIFLRCSSWTCPTQPWWRSPLDVILSWAIWDLTFDACPWKDT